MPMRITATHDRPTEVTFTYDRHTGVVKVPGYKPVTIHTYSSEWTDDAVQRDVLREVARYFPNFCTLRIPGV